MTEEPELWKEVGKEFNVTTRTYPSDRGQGSQKAPSPQAAAVN